MKVRKNISTLHLPHNKHTAGVSSVRVAPPAEVLLPLSMHSGAPAVPVVSVGDYVRVGQLIAEEGGNISSPVYATVSGTVKAIEPYVKANGKSVMAIRIESDGKMEKDPNLAPPVVNDLDSFLAAVRKSGVVGLGGAAFPLWAKLDAVRKNQVDTVLVNGAECEPYITSDHRMMLENTEMLVKGVELLKQYVSSDKVVLCIEDNKQDAIDKLSKIFENDPRVEIFSLPTIYPQGAKQVLLYNVTGKVVKGGQRMASLGVLILNVSSMTKMAEYIETGMPLVDRIVTVCGSAMKQPTNLIAPIGTPISYIIDQAGGLKEEAGKVLIGGPMLGHAQLSLDAPTEKATNAVLVMNKKEAKVYEPTTCIRCGRCVANCPAKLNPTAIARAMEEENEEKRLALLEKTSVGQCIECACCSYVCPAHKPLLEINNEARAFMKNAKKKEGGK